MNQAVVIIGIGEIGSVLARGLLKTGHPVYPVTRDMNIEEQAKHIVNPGAVIVAVGENDLHPILSVIPENWQENLVLIQNELLPGDWQQYDFPAPSIISIWFEKKKGQDVKVVVPSPIYGKKAQLMFDAFQVLDIPAEIISDEAEMTMELVRKNYYILTSNIAGLITGGTVSELWNNHQNFAKAVINDIHSLQQYLVGGTLDNEALTKAMLIAFEGDPEHGCVGRSAPARLERALQIADNAGLTVSTLRKISDSVKS
jgi:ketopantoate reductase